MTQAGPAIPVVVSSQPPDGSPALRVAVVSDGRNVEAGPMRPMVEVFDNRPTQANEPLPIVVARGNGFTLAGPPQPVRVVSGYLGSAYGAKIAALGPIAFWPMDEPSGSVAFDRSGNGRNGAYTGVALGQPGVDGRTSAGFDGATSYNNVLGASLAAAFNGSEGSIALWAKVSGSGVWSDGVLRRLFHLTVDASNQLSIFKSTANNRVDMVYLAGGVTKTVITTGLTSLGFIHFGLTWGKSADAVKAYVGGAQSGATQTGLGVWAGVPTLMIVGAGSLIPANVMSGAEAYGAVFARALSSAEMLSAATP